MINPRAIKHTWGKVTGSAIEVEIGTPVTVNLKGSLKNQHVIVTKIDGERARVKCFYTDEAKQELLPLRALIPMNEDEITQAADVSLQYLVRTKFYKKDDKVTPKSEDDKTCFKIEIDAKGRAHLKPLHGNAETSAFEEKASTLRMATRDDLEYALAQGTQQTFHESTEAKFEKGDIVYFTGDMSKNAYLGDKLFIFKKAINGNARLIDYFTGHSLKHLYDMGKLRLAPQSRIDAAHKIPVAKYYKFSEFVIHRETNRLARIIKFSNDNKLAEIKFVTPPINEQTGADDKSPYNMPENSIITIPTAIELRSPTDKEADLYLSIMRGNDAKTSHTPPEDPHP